MSDPVTNVEIEDVLSSIRRLVSEDSRPRTPQREVPRADRLVLTPALRVQEAPSDPETTPEPMLLTNRADNPIDETHDGNTENAGVTPTSLLAQLVEDEVARAFAENDPDETEEELAFLSKPTRPSSEQQASVAKDMTPSDTGGESDESAPDQTSLVSQLPENEVTKPMDLSAFAKATVEDAPSEVDAVTSGSAIEETVTKDAPPSPEEHLVTDPNSVTDPDLEKKILALEALFKGQGTGAAPQPDEVPEASMAVDVAPPDVVGIEPASADPLPETDETKKSSDEATAWLEDGALEATGQEQSNSPSGDVESDVAQPRVRFTKFRPGTDETSEPDGSETEVATPQAHVVDGDVPRFVRSPTSDVLDWEDHLPTGPATAAHSVEAQDQNATSGWSNAQEVGESVETAPVIDEAHLREMVGEIVRQELQGVLGERITRNVRKLVRREIHRVMMTQDYD